jgi:hypothetical protein
MAARIDHPVELKEMRMALGRDRLENILMRAGGPSEQGMKMMLFSASIAPMMDDEEHWAEICEFAVAVDEEHELSSGFRRCVNHPDLLKSALLDNYVLAAIAAFRAGVHGRHPLVAWAAANKREFPGIGNGVDFETGTLRFLQWAGADVSMPDPESKMTALHCMASLTHGRGSAPRAVKRLLDGGANPAAKNIRGDTPLAYMCGMSVWGEAQRETFQLLVRAGGDPLAQSDDGGTAIDLLKMVQDISPQPMRLALIGALERDIASQKPGFFTRAIGAARPIAWAESLAA